MGKLKCPHCNTENLRTKNIDKEMAKVGKAVIECTYCHKLFVLRDEGDGEFVAQPRKEVE